MQRILLTIGNCGLLLTSLALSALAELDDSSARQAAIQSIESRKGGIGADCLKTRRKEELEEDLFDIRSEKVSQGKLNETFFVYEVVDVGCYEAKDSSLVIHMIDHPGTFGYVAVNRQTGKSYRLWSDQDAANQFNRLITDLGVDAANPHRALSVAILYRKTVGGPYEGNRVYSNREVKQLAEESFNSAFDEDWSKRFSAWWDRFKRAKKISYDEAEKKVPEGLEVTGRAFKGFALTIPRTKTSGQPTISEWRLIVLPDGRINELPSRIIFE